MMQQGPKCHKRHTSCSDWSRDTCNRLQRKRLEKAAKVKTGETTTTATKEYVQLVSA
jgi:hypothetical protein